MAVPSELELLERVFLRVGTAETDEQLQSVVSKFLLPVLLKLSSQQDGVRKRVMELLVHINKRIKSRSKIQLPFEALLLQYQDPLATSFVTNFTIIYLKLGYPRLEMSKRAELIPRILNCLDGKPPSHQDSLLVLMLPVFNHFPIPSDPKKCKLVFNFNEKPQIAKLLLDFLLDVLLLPYGTVGASKSPSIEVTVTVDPPSGRSNASSQPSSAPPGLSEHAYKRITAEAPISSEDLEQIKLGIVKFIRGGFFLDDEIIPHLIVASADTRHSVVSAVGAEIQRLKSLTLGSVPILNTLYSLFLGTDEAGKDKTTKPELKRNSVSLRIRMKIFPFFIRSPKGAAHFPSNLQVIFESLFGSNSHPKLKLMGVEFVRYVVGASDDRRLATIGPILLSGMERVITEAKDDRKLRGAAYTMIGELGRQLPHLVNKDLKILQQLFKALNEEDQDTKLSVQSSLTSMIKSFCNLDSTKVKLMEELFASNMNDEDPSVRLVTVQYISQVFPTDHIPSRYLLLLAAGDNKEEVCAEASKILNTVPSKSDNAVKYPSFADLVFFINEKAEQQKHKIVRDGGKTLPFQTFTCTEMITYMRLCLIHDAGIVCESRNSDDMLDQAPSISKYVRELISQKHGVAAIQLYINFITSYLSVVKSWNAMYYLLEIVAVAPDILTPQFKEKLSWIKNFVFDNHKEMRSNACQLYAILVAYSFGLEDFNKCVLEYISSLNDKNSHIVHGSILLLGYLIGRRIRLFNDSITNLLKCIEEFVKLLKSPSSLIVSAVCIALGEIGCYKSLPLPDGEIEKNDSLTKLSLICSLVNLVKSTNLQDNVYEKAALAVSYICAGDETFTYRREVIARLLLAEQRKDMELHFTVGDALGWICRGYRSQLVRDIWTVSEDDLMDTESEETSSDLSWLLTEICEKLIKSPDQYSRQAACVWLVAILKRCHTMKTAKNYMEKLQKVFISLLTENNELTQDCASKGLSLVYDYSDEQQKTNMVSVLVDSLANGRRSNQQPVTGDTKIFEDGALGLDPHGGSISTYKELCSLASDLNQPDLIYKFMHLANDNAVWNSKKGAAFGFGMIAEKAGAQLQPHLPKILPKLYRYQFDPNSKIRKSMTGIWQAIVTDPKTMIDKYVKEILADLKVNLTSGMWRTRESSCLALADLLRGRQLDTIIDDFPELWEICFRVRDDIKESVRVAADTTLNVLSKITIRLCDSNTGAGALGDKAIASVLPVLLNSGLSSPVGEVKAISLVTLTEIGKGAGILLKPHIPLLTVSLLESLSTLEHQELNYLSVRLGDQRGTQEKLDSARIAAAKSSPMMDTINKCLPFVDEEVLMELIPRLIDLIKSSVGLSTKAGCAHYTIILTQHTSNYLQPHSGKLLAALLHGLNDVNVVVRKSYALAIGYVVKTAKDSSVEKLIERLKASYMEKGEVAQQTTGFVLNAIAKQNPDVLKLHSAKVLPLAFLAMHSPNLDNDQERKEDKSKEMWEEIWIDITPSSETGIRLYLSEIVEMIQMAFKSQAWSMKAKAAAAVSTVATTLKSSLENSKLELLLNAVVGELSGRTWSGKEYLLRATTALCIHCKIAVLNLSENSGVTLSKIIDALLKECKKDVLSYKVEAIKCTSEILEGLEHDRFQEMFKIAQPIVGKDKEDHSDEEGGNKSYNNIKTDEAIFEALGKCWPRFSKETQDIYQEEFCDFLCESFVKYGAKVQIAIFKCLVNYIDKLHILETVNRHKQTDKLKNIIIKVIIKLYSFRDIKSTTARSQIVEIVFLILSKLPAELRFTIISNELRNHITALTTEMIKDSQTELRSKCEQVLILLKSE